MQTKQDITPRNERGKPHGCWEVYWGNGQLQYKGNYVNGLQDRYWEVYSSNGKLWEKGNYVNGKEVGLWFENGKKYFYAN